VLIFAITCTEISMWYFFLACRSYNEIDHILTCGRVRQAGSKVVIRSQAFYSAVLQMLRVCSVNKVYGETVTNTSELSSAHQSSLIPTTVGSNF